MPSTIEGQATRLVDFASTGDEGFITDDDRSTFALVQGPIPTSFDPAAGIGDELQASMEKVSADTDFTGGVTSYGLAVRR